MRIMILGFIAILFAGCSVTHVAPSGSGPSPGYVEVDGTPEAAWDAVLDLIADFGLDFDFISAEMRIARISGVIAAGPARRLPTGRQALSALERRRPSDNARRWADCGTINGKNATGMSDLHADISIRVREVDGVGIAKVVVPRMWIGTGPESSARCVSTGVFESEWEERIEDRIHPIMRGGSGVRQP